MSLVYREDHALKNVAQPLTALPSSAGSLAKAGDHVCEPDDRTGRRDGNYVLAIGRTLIWFRGALWGRPRASMTSRSLAMKAVNVMESAVDSRNVVEANVDKHRSMFVFPCACTRAPIYVFIPWDLPFDGDIK